MAKICSDLCRNIKNGMCWDEIFMAPAPGTYPVLGYRINISLESEEAIEQAKKILRDEGIVFDDRKANSFSKTVQPGDRTLRVIHQKSVTDLQRMWNNELRRIRTLKTLSEKSKK